MGWTESWSTWSQIGRNHEVMTSWSPPSDLLERATETTHLSLNDSREDLGQTFPCSVYTHTQTPHVQCIQYVCKYMQVHVCIYMQVLYVQPVCKCMWHIRIYVCMHTHNTYIYVWTPTYVQYIYTHIYIYFCVYMYSIYLSYQRS